MVWRFFYWLLKVPMKSRLDGDNFLAYCVVLAAAFLLLDWVVVPPLD